MKAQQGRGFQNDGGMEQPARVHEEGNQADDEAIREAEIGGSFDVQLAASREKNRRKSDSAGGVP